MTLTENEKRTVIAVFDELLKMKYDDLNKFLGSLTITEMHQLYEKMRYDNYCKARGIRFEDMGPDEFEDAWEQGYV